MRKNAKTVSILLSVAIMFATVFAIISVTYSWFNKITATNITSINMTTSDSEGILLSGNGLNWSPTLTTDGSIASIDINEEVNITSISTGGTVVNGSLQFYKVDFVTNSFASTLLTEPTLYYVFDMYVLNQDTTYKKLTLGKNSTVVGTNDKGLEFSARVAFLNLGHSSNMLDAIELDGTGVSSVDYIWEPNSTSRHDKLDMYQSSYIDEGKLSYKGLNVATSSLTLENSVIIDALGTPEQEVVNITTYDPIKAGDLDDITLLAADSITKLRVYVWSEGQDIDNVNSISGGTADLNLSFGSYNVQLVGQNYVAIEKFDAPTIVNTEGATYNWSATNTNLSLETFSEEYVFKISKYVSSELIPIRTIFTTQTSLNIDNLENLEMGTYYVQVKVYSPNLGNSNYSNTLTFSVLEIPQDFAILSSTISWSSVSNAASYTIKVYDDSTQTTYLTTTTSLSLDLATTMFDGDIYLPTGKQYYISVKANGNLGFANSEYSSTLNWLY